MFALKVCCILFAFSHVFSSVRSFDAEEWDLMNSRKYYAGKIENFLETDQRLSSVCSNSLRAYVAGLASFEEWALMMFDSGSKFPSGILDGNLNDLGTFDECLNVEGLINGSTTVSGRYCLGTLSISFADLKFTHHQTKLRNPLAEPSPKGIGSPLGMALLLSTCMPDTCSVAEIQELYLGLGVNMVFSEELCQTKADQPELDGGAIGAISFFGVVLWIIVVSTVYDVILHYTKSKPTHSLLVAFSLFTNGKKIITTTNNKEGGQISCMHGIRVISTMWVILGHKYTMGLGLPMKNSAAISQWALDEVNMFVMGATVSVDTFFVMGGIVLVYSFLGAMEKGTKFNIFWYYLHRYLRLTPALAVMIIINVTLVKYFATGPMWKASVVGLSDGCVENWWRALLYIQNYEFMGELACVSQTWYLSVDMQLFLFSPVILLPMAKYPMVGLALTGILTAGSIVSCFVTAWVYELNGQFAANLSFDYAKKYYGATHNRASAWLIGILFGYFIFKLGQRKTKLIINKGIILLLWSFSLAVLCVCVFAGHNLIIEYDRLESSFYIALVRPAWAIGCGWMILACYLGYGGPINWFLSLPLFQVLSKLTYALYLVHVLTLFLPLASMRVAPWFSNGEYLYSLWADFMMSVAAATVLTLAFESPLITIEKLLFGGGGRKRSKNTSEKSPEVPQDLESNQRLSLSLRKSSIEKESSAFEKGSDNKAFDIFETVREPGSELKDDNFATTVDDVEKGGSGTSSKYNRENEEHNNIDKKPEVN